MFDSVDSDLMLRPTSCWSHSTEAGYRRIAFAGWVDIYDGVASTLPEKRYRAYKQWAEEAGIVRRDASASREARPQRRATRLTRKILSEADRPDALITANDNMAVSAYRAIHEMGLRISRRHRSGGRLQRYLGGAVHESAAHHGASGCRGDR